MASINAEKRWSSIQHRCAGSNSKTRNEYNGSKRLVVSGGGSLGFEPPSICDKRVLSPATNRAGTTRHTGRPNSTEENHFGGGSVWSRIRWARSPRREKGSAGAASTPMTPTKLSQLVRARTTGKTSLRPQLTFEIDKDVTKRSAVEVLNIAIETSTINHGMSKRFLTHTHTCSLFANVEQAKSSRETWQTCKIRCQLPFLRSLKLRNLCWVKLLAQHWCRTLWVQVVCQLHSLPFKATGYFRMYGRGTTYSGWVVVEEKA